MGRLRGPKTGRVDCFAFADEARAITEELLPGTRLEVVGSVARGDVQPPYELSVDGGPD